MSWSGACCASCTKSEGAAHRGESPDAGANRRRWRLPRKGEPPNGGFDTPNCSFRPIDGASEAPDPVTPLEKDP